MGAFRSRGVIRTKCTTNRILSKKPKSVPEIQADEVRRKVFSKDTVQQRRGWSRGNNLKVGKQQFVGLRSQSRILKQEDTNRDAGESIAEKNTRAISGWQETGSNIDDGGPIIFWDSPKIASSAPEDCKNNTSIEKNDCHFNASSETFGVMAMSEAMLAWCRSQLMNIAKNDDMTLLNYCYSLHDPSEIRAYLANYMGSTPEVSKFASEFIEWKSRKKSSSVFPPGSSPSGKSLLPSEAVSKKSGVKRGRRKTPKM